MISLSSEHTKSGDKMEYNTDLARERLTHLKENKDYTFNKIEFNSVTLEQYDFLTTPKGHYDELIFLEYQQEDIYKAMFYILEKYQMYKKILIVGLGNASFNADAIGPLIVSKMEVVLDRLFLFIPRVKGQTGMESALMIKSMVDVHQIDLVIAIDSLSAIDSDSLYQTIQMNTMGIQPGSGVGNHTMAINKEYLGCEVLAIGVPCVIRISHLINEFYQYAEGFFSENLNDHTNILKVVRTNPYQGILDDERKTFLFGQLGMLQHDDRYQLIEEIMNPINKNYVVTSKDIDHRIDILSNILSYCLTKIFK